MEYKNFIHVASINVIQFNGKDNISPVHSTLQETHFNSILPLNDASLSVTTVGLFIVICVNVTHSYIFQMNNYEL